MAKLRVSDVMRSNVFSLRPADDLASLRDIMCEHQVRHVPIVDKDGDLVGLVSHRDLLRNSLIEQAETTQYMEDTILHNLKAGDIMETNVESVEAGTDLREAAGIMLENKYGCLPVVEGRRLVGIITEADFVRLMSESE